MNALQVAAFLLVAAGGTLVIAMREPLRQTLAVGLYGLTLVVLFLVLQAPDVALSELVVGAVGLPLVLMVALAATRR